MLKKIDHFTCRLGDHALAVQMSMSEWVRQRGPSPGIDLIWIVPIVFLVISFYTVICLPFAFWFYLRGLNVRDLSYDREEIDLRQREERQREDEEFERRYMNNIRRQLESLAEYKRLHPDNHVDWRNEGF